VSLVTERRRRGRRRGVIAMSLRPDLDAPRFLA
jgi:hypothetical protein